MSFRITPVSALKQLQEIEQKVKGRQAPVFQLKQNIYQNGFQILTGVLISSRTKDQITLEASRRLFLRAKNFRQLADLSEAEIAALIYPAGFYRIKSRQLKKIAELLKEKEEIPQTMSELLKLPGIGIKSASLILQLAFDRAEIAVDTHVQKVSQRLGWTSEKKPEKIARDLAELFPVSIHKKINLLLVAFGQTICLKKKPLCKYCPLTASCLYFRQQSI